MRLSRFLPQKPEKSDVFLFIGMTLLFFGTYRIYQPASYIIIGVLLILLAVIPEYMIARRVK